MKSQISDNYKMSSSLRNVLSDVLTPSLPHWSNFFYNSLLITERGKDTQREK